MPESPIESPNQAPDGSSEDGWQVYCALFPEDDFAGQKLHPIYYRSGNPSPTWVRPSELSVESAEAKFDVALTLWAQDNPDIADEILARGPVRDFDYHEDEAQGGDE